MARWHDNSLSRRSYRARSLLHGRWSEWFCTPCLSGYFQFGDNGVSCGVILNSFYINVQGFFHKAANQNLVQSYVQEERTYVRSRDYPNFSDMHGYPNKPIPMYFDSLSMYCNSHLVPRLGGIKQKKVCYSLLCLKAILFVLFPPSLGAKSESESPAIISPFWLIFLSFFRFWPFQSGKGKRLDMLKMKKILFAVVFIAMWQGKWIFPYDMHT